MVDSSSYSTGFLIGCLSIQLNKLEIFYFIRFFESSKLLLDDMLLNVAYLVTRALQLGKTFFHKRENNGMFPIQYI